MDNYLIAKKTITKNTNYVIFYKYWLFPFLFVLIFLKISISCYVFADEVPNPLNPPTPQNQPTPQNLEQPPQRQTKPNPIFEKILSLSGANQASDLESALNQYFNYLIAFLTTKYVLEE
ncbi:MAG: hypothetical protein ACQBVK_05385 [Candidatus Phytoplasma sp. TWB_XP]